MADTTKPKAPAESSMGRLDGLFRRVVSASNKDVRERMTEEKARRPKAKGKKA